VLRNAGCKLKKPTNNNPDSDFVSAAIAFTPWVVHSAWVKRITMGVPPWWDTSFDGLIAEDFSFWFKVLQGAKSLYSPHAGVFYRVDTADRRNTESDLERYLDSLDKGVEANLKILAARGQELNYRHRQALFNLHLGLLRFRFTRQQAGLRRRIEARIRTLRPSFREAVGRRDWAVALSYILPWPVLRQWVERRRQKIASRTTCAAEPEERNK
jgi:hypothetical protein